MVTASTAFAVVKLIVALGAAASAISFLISRVRVKISSVTISFTVVFLLLCILSAKLACDSYRDELVRRSTWKTGIAVVISQSPGNKNDPCFVTYRFAPKAPSGANLSPVTDESSLDTQDECDQYKAGAGIRIHYPPGDPSKLRPFLHGENTKSQDITNYTAQSIILDLMFGMFCFFGWLAANGIGALFFAKPAEPAKS